MSLSNLTVKCKISRPENLQIAKKDDAYYNDREFVVVREKLINAVNVRVRNFVGALERRTVARETVRL